MDMEGYLFIGVVVTCGGLLIFVFHNIYFDESESTTKPANNESRTTTCRDCNGLVSKSAQKCPHCGANTPYMGVTGFSTFKIINTVVLFILFIVLMLVIFYVFSTWIISEDQRERQRLYEIFRYNQSR